MEALVDRAMEDGAYGLSSGLFYAPGAFATTDEVVALAKRVAPFGGRLHQPHPRRGQLRRRPARVGGRGDPDRRSRRRHRHRQPHESAGARQRGARACEAAEHIERARARGVRVFADQYPYDASSTSLPARRDPASGRRTAAAERAGAAGTTRRPAPKLVDEVRENIRRRGGPGVACRSRTTRPIARSRAGRSTRSPRRAASMPRTRRARLSSKGQRVDRVVQHVRATTSRDIMRQPVDDDVERRRAGQDGRGRAASAQLRRVSAQARRATSASASVLSLEAAVQSMTGLPARGVRHRRSRHARRGAAADVLVFDPAAVRDTATYTKPHQLAEGMSCVFVNGVAVLDERRVDRRAGRGACCESAARRRRPRRLRP